MLHDACVNQAQAFSVQTYTTPRSTREDSKSKLHKLLWHCLTLASFAGHRGVSCTLSLVSPANAHNSKLYVLGTGAEEEV